MRSLIVWHNLNDDTYYYKFIKFLHDYHKIGFINQYNHEIVLILYSNEFTPVYYRVSLLKSLLNVLIYFLNLLIRFLEYIKRIF